MEVEGVKPVFGQGFIIKVESFADAQKDDGRLYNGKYLVYVDDLRPLHNKD